MEPQTEAREPNRGWQTEAERGEGRLSSERRADWPVVDLLRELGRESQALVKGEAQLVRAEMSEKLAQAERGIASMVSGGAVLFAGLVLTLSAIALALSLAMDAWVAFLIVGLASAIIGAAMVAAGKKRVQPRNLKPERAIEEARADGRFVKQRFGS